MDKEFERAQRALVTVAESISDILRSIAEEKNPTNSIRTMLHNAEILKNHLEAEKVPAHPSPADLGLGTLSLSRHLGDPTDTGKKTKGRTK